ncbi:MAG: dephospho-CoA kinase [Euryarchaeota archaeon]|nr:dephospho-CoA kinase [Euryarchaeota archaeon]|tara:strand:- start:2728 stop:3282 length:555 start_codon:yes stop_codon:yes gene_type:complete
MAQVYAVCGMPGSGKGEFAAVLSNKGIPVVSMGDMVRAEVRSRELPENPSIFGEVAAELRAEFGEDVLAVRLGDRVDELLQNHSIVLIEGLRGTAERTVFSSRWNDEFQTVAIDTSEELRFVRIQQRGRSEDGDRAAFEVRNQREVGWGLDVLIAEADTVISNDLDLDAFVAACEAWLHSVKTA